MRCVPRAWVSHEHDVVARHRQANLASNRPEDSFAPVAHDGAPQLLACNKRNATGWVALRLIMLFSYDAESLPIKPGP